MRLRDLLQYDEIVVQCHDNPDADAIGSGFALYRYLLSKGKAVRLVYGGRSVIRKSNLRLMIETLGVPVEHVESLARPPLLVTVDCQYGSGNVTRFDAEEIAIIDHHRVSVELPRLSEVRSTLGSCATLIWSMLADEGFRVNEHEDIATALYYGLYMDTNGFSEIFHPLDKDLRDEARFSTELITRYRNANMSLEELETAGAALMQCDYNEEYRFGVVKAAECEPNILGVISDLLLEVDSVDTCLVFSLQTGGVKLSVRSCIREVKASELAKEVCRGIGDGGGHLTKAGGFIEMELLNRAYASYCQEHGYQPRMELEADGKREHPSTSAVRSFLVNRIVDYFNNSEIIYAKTYQVNKTDMTRYVGKPVMLGYVMGREMFPVGTMVTVRTIEEDIETTIEEDTVIIIGVKGEVYLNKEAGFLDDHHVYPDRFRLEHAEYTPTIRALDSGEVLSPMDFARACVPCERKVVMAKPLTHTVKVFMEWDESKYVLGRRGDYLVVSENDDHDIVPIGRSIFEKSYQRLRDPAVQRYDAVVFDLDGTLLNTLEDLTDAVNYAMEQNIMPLCSREQVRSYLGNGMRYLMSCAVPGGQEHPAYEKAYEDFRSFYEAHCMNQTSPYPGIRILLEELRQRGIRMAIVSNKADPAVKELNDQYFSDYIDVAIGETETIARKPAPDTVLEALAQLRVVPERALYVGDSEVDLHTAENAGMRCITVTWGFRDREFLAIQGAQTLIDQPLELLSLM